MVLGRGAVSYERGTPVQAYQAATELSPEHATAHFNLGVAFAARGTACGLTEKHIDIKIDGWMDR